MSAAVGLLDEALESWGYAREGVLAELDGIPESRWAERLHPHARSVEELARHVVESGLMMVGELTDPEGDFTRASPPDIMAAHAGQIPDEATPEEWKRLLRSTLEDGIERFRQAGEVAMLQTIRRFDGARWTRLAWMHHGIAHEEYHRGQLAIMARAMGLVPALTRLIYGEDAE